MKVNVQGKIVEIENPDMVRAIRAQLAPKGPAAKRDPRAASILRIADWETEQRKGPGLFIPLYLRNPANVRQHWRPGARDNRMQRAAAAFVCAGASLPKTFPVRVTFTRYGPRRMDPDGVVASLKHVQDGVADYFAGDDGDAGRFEWIYNPHADAPAGCYGVRMEFSYERQAGDEGSGSAGGRRSGIRSRGPGAGADRGGAGGPGGGGGGNSRTPARKRRGGAAGERNGRRRVRAE